MAVWNEVRGAVEQTWGGERLNDSITRFEVGLSNGESCSMILRKEIIPPDLEFILIEAPIGYVGRVDLGEALRAAGQLTVGGLGYMPAYDGELLTLGLRSPLRVIDMVEVKTLLLHANLLGMAAATLQRQLGGGHPD